MNRSSRSKGVQELDADGFRNAVQHGVVLVHFGEPWCGLCALQRPILERVAERVGGRARLASLNVDQAPDLVAHYGIATLPTLVLFKAGHAVHTFVGVNSETALTQAILSAAGTGAPEPNQGTVLRKRTTRKHELERHRHLSRSRWTPSSGPLLVHFCTGWSGPCRMLTRSVRVVARKLKGRLQIAEVNVDQQPELAAQYAITQVPTLILFDHATPIDRLSGVMSPEELSVHLRGVLADYADPVAQGHPMQRARASNARPSPAR